MKIKLTKEFRDKLKAQVEYIARDKPTAARKFKNELLSKIKHITDNPFSNRQSIYFTDKDIRDLIFKGYTIVYQVKKEQKVIIVFGFVKYEEKP